MTFFYEEDQIFNNFLNRPRLAFHFTFYNSIYDVLVFYAHESRLRTEHIFLLVMNY